MTAEKWVGYNELAWIETIIAPPEEYTAETEIYCREIKKNASLEPKTLLHLGCGAGNNDFIFKRQFKVTGVDISPGMLHEARKKNPEVEYYEGDMRTVRLDLEFDAVAVPESIGYMTTVEDLRSALQTAFLHLKTGGVLLVGALLKEDFRENNFAYSGKRGSLSVTVFENNFWTGPAASTYEATIIYLIRREGDLEIHYDRHTLGLFAAELWQELLREQGFNVTRLKMSGLYDQFLLGEGRYEQRLFVCTKA